MPKNRDESLEERRAQLGAELASKRAEVGEETQAEGRARESRKGFAYALKLSSEFIAAIIVGAFLGYFFDRYVGTAPWGLIVFLLMGFVAGVMNVLRSAGRIASPSAGNGDGKG